MLLASIIKSNDFRYYKTNVPVNNLRELTRISAFYITEHCCYYIKPQHTPQENYSFTRGKF